MKKRYSFLTWLSVPIGVIFVVVGMFLYQLLGPAISLKTESQKIYIPTRSTFLQVKKNLSPYLEHDQAFVWWARLMKYDRQVKPGCYQIKNKQSIYDLISMLRAGKQVEIRLSFNASATHHIFERIAQQIEPSQELIRKSFEDPEFLRLHGLNQQTIISILIPNTYRVFWNVSPDRFRDRMLREYRSFWNKARKEKAKKIGLTQLEVSTLASIIGKETSKLKEMPTIAGLYINRLKRGFPLQADPTVVFALKQAMNCDTCSIQRVLLKDLQIASPFNTYKNKGLPPAPIAVPSIHSIDAVLNHQKHRYIFMCASIENIGYHEFSEDLKTHNINRAKYTRWLNRQKIFR